jgi:hypothetical protein
MHVDLKQCRKSTGPVFLGSETTPSQVLPHSHIGSGIERVFLSSRHNEGILEGHASIQLFPVHLGPLPLAHQGPISAFAFLTWAGFGLLTRAVDAATLPTRNLSIEVHVCRDADAVARTSAIRASGFGLSCSIVVPLVSPVLVQHRRTITHLILYFLGQPTKTLSKEFQHGIYCFWEFATL